MQYFGVPHRPLDQLLPQEYLLLPQYYLTRRLCVHCGVYYYEHQNLAELACRLHTGVKRYDERRRGYFYSCCDSEDERGCVEADHLDESLSAVLEERWVQLRAWLKLAVPRVLYNYGLLPPRHNQVVMDISGQSQLERTRTLQLPFGGAQLQLQARPIGQLLAQQATESPTLTQLVAQQDERQRLRQATMRELDGSNWEERRQQGQAQQRATPDTSKTLFIPFLVLARLKLGA